MSQDVFIDPEMGEIPLEPADGDSEVADEVKDRIEEQENPA